MNSLSTLVTALKTRTALPRSRIARVLLTTIVILLLFIVMFDWDWLRPAILRNISHESQRSISASHLDVEFNWRLQPTIRLHDLYIENASWAGQPITKPKANPQPPETKAISSSSTPPLIAVKEIAFSFAAFKMLFAEKRLISNIYIRDGEVNLEQLQNGLRNWRLLQPQYTGPGQYVIMALQAENSTIRFRHHGLQLELQAVANPYAAAFVDSAAAPLTNAITLQGSYRGSLLDGQLHTGPLLTFQRTGLYFPINGYVRSGKTSLSVNGELGDLFLNQHIDANLAMAGDTLSAFNPFMNLQLAASPAFKASAHLLKQQNRYRATHLQGQLGGTDIQGELTYINDKQQPLLEGTLNSKLLNLDQLTAMTAHAEQADAHAAGGQAAAKRKPAAASSTRLFSATAIPIAGLNARDMHLVLSAGKLKSSQWPALENISTTMTLQHGTLKLQPLQASLHGSDIHAQFQLQASKQPLTASLNLQVGKLPMQQLLASTKWSGMVSAPLSAKLDIQGQGSSVAQILTDASGHIGLSLAPGTISNKLDARLGLDTGKMAWLALRGDKRIVLHCASMQIALTKGIGQVRQLWMDSAQTVLTGSGNINLREETVNLLLIPHPKDPSLLALNSAIQVNGSLPRPAVKLNKHAADHTAPSLAKSSSGC